MNDYPVAECEPKSLVKPDLRDGLVCRQKRLQEQLNDVTEAIAALDKNPEVARVLELVGKAGRY
jgi:hypothetical protein